MATNNKRIEKKAAAAVSGTARIFDPTTPRATARVILGDVFMAHGKRALHHHGGTYWSWASTHVAEVEPATMRSKIYDKLDEAMELDRKVGAVPFKTNRRRVGEVDSALAALVHIPTIGLEPPAWLDGGDGKPPADELLSCRNGLLHVPTGKLLPKNPAFFTYNALPFAHDNKAAEPERWLAFLGELWGDDTEAIATLQEWFGYVLLPDTSQQKMCMLVGPKRSGKGTIGRVLTELVGRRNIVAPTLASLGQQFGLQPLMGKQLAIISDARIGHKTDLAMVAERLLSISGEDSQTVPRKFLPDWTGHIPIRFMLLSNELPKIKACLSG